MDTTPRANRRASGEAAAARPLLQGGRVGARGRPTAWRRFLRNRRALIAAAVLIPLHLLAALASVLAPYDPEAVDLSIRFLAPDSQHWLGTDESGRDIVSRLLFGSRVSLAVGSAAMLIALTLGTLLGAAAGFWGRSADSIIMRITDGMLSIPLFFFLLTTLALLGTSLLNIVLVIAITSWMSVARVVRGDVLKFKHHDFVDAAFALGCSTWRVLFRHVLPHAFPSIIVGGTLGVANAVLTESALSYLGLGVQPPTPSWGNMLSDARRYLWTSPVLAFYPGILIFITVMAYNSLGDGLRDALDPTLSSE